MEQYRSMSASLLLLMGEHNACWKLGTLPERIKRQLEVAVKSDFCNKTASAITVKQNANIYSHYGENGHLQETLYGRGGGGTCNTMNNRHSARPGAVASVCGW